MNDVGLAWNDIDLCDISCVLFVDQDEHHGHVPPQYIEIPAFLNIIFYQKAFIGLKSARKHAKYRDKTHIRRKLVVTFEIEKCRKRSENNHQNAYKEKIFGQKASKTINFLAKKAYIGRNVSKKCKLAFLPGPHP